MIGIIPWDQSTVMRMLTRELEHQNMSLKERLLVARNQLMGGPAKNRRYAF
jgi:hypothetical protein